MAEVAMEEVRRLRREKGWSQTELAYHANLSSSVISQVESGKRNPGSTTLGKLARGLGVEVADLFPKAAAQDPLFEEEERRSPLLDSWTAYLKKRTRDWERELPKSARALEVIYPQHAETQHRRAEADLEEEMRADPRLAFEVLHRSASVQSEASALLIAAIAARRDPVHAAAQPDRADLVEFRPAVDRAHEAAQKWSIAAEVARGVADEEDLRRADLKPVRENEEARRNAVAAFGGIQLAS